MHCVKFAATMCQYRDKKPFRIQKAVVGFFRRIGGANLELKSGQKNQ